MTQRLCVFYPPLVISHRGGAALFPENTLYAFEKSLELGVDGVELDVQLTQDGHVVVYHDLTLNPHLTRDFQGHWIDQRIPIKDLSLKEIQAFDVGRLKPGTPLAAQRPQVQGVDNLCPPTLKQVLKLFKNRPESIWIELKTLENDAHSGDPLKLVEKVLDLLQGYPNLQRIRLISFDWRSLDYLQKKAPDLSLGYLTDHDRNDILGALKKRNNSLWNANFTELTMDICQKAKDQGLKVAVWTLNNDQDIKQALAMNLYAITTDVPYGVKKWISLLINKSPR